MQERGLGQRDIFSGLPPSKQAWDLVVRAFGLGLDPTLYAQRAERAAEREGKRKVGLFGEAGKQLAPLKVNVQRAEGNSGMRRAYMKSNSIR